MSSLLSKNIVISQLSVSQAIGIHVLFFNFYRKLTRGHHRSLMTEAKLRMNRALSATKLRFLPIFPNAEKYKLAKRHTRITWYTPWSR